MIVVIVVVVFLLCLGGYFFKRWYDSTHSIDLIEQAEDDNKPKYDNPNNVIDMKTSLRFDPKNNIDNNPYLKAGVVAA